MIHSVELTFLFDITQDVSRSLMLEYYHILWYIFDLRKVKMIFLQCSNKTFWMLKCEFHIIFMLHKTI